MDRLFSKEEERRCARTVRNEKDKITIFYTQTLFAFIQCWSIFGFLVYVCNKHSCMHHINVEVYSCHLFILIILTHQQKYFLCIKKRRQVILYYYTHWNLRWVMTKITPLLKSSHFYVQVTRFQRSSVRHYRITFK